VRPSSLKFRLALLVGVLGLVQAAAVLAFSYATMEKVLDRQKRAVLLDKAQQARLLIDAQHDTTALKANAARLAELVSGNAELHLAAGDSASGEVLIAFSPEAAESLARLRDDVWATNAFLVWEPSGKPTRMLSLAAAGKLGDGRAYEVVLSLNRADDMRVLRELLLTAASAAPFALALMFLSASIIVSLGLKPLLQFKRAAGAVSAQALASRLSLEGLPGELRDLAQAFNAMLDRLDEGVSRLSRFSGDLAHEMRTPLATLLGRTQVALSQSRSVDHLVDVLEENVEELRQLSRLVTDMLFLAQTEQAQSALVIAQVDLALEAARIAEFLLLAAQERDVSIAVEGHAQVRADKGLVQRAVMNLMTNAIRHCDAGTQVHVLIGIEGDEAVLRVINRGAPMDERHLSKLFERFYRGDSSRARDLGGTGLGLAIVRAIMALHRGSAQVSTNATGEVEFSLRFRARRADDEFVMRGPSQLQG
jgi:two-component system heavy metal sensor histidine kinase CusS